MNDKGSCCECERYRRLALEAMQEGDWEKAKGLHLQTIALHEDHAAAWGNLGLCHAQLGAPAEAARCYERALSLDPHHKHTHVNKGSLLAAEGDYLGALDCFETALRLDPGLEMAADNRRRALRDLAKHGISKEIEVSALRVVQRNGRYFVEAAGVLLKTPNRTVIESTTSALPERIVADFAGHDRLLMADGVIIEPRVMSAYILTASRFNFMDPRDDTAERLVYWLLDDPAFQATAGHPIIANYQTAQQTPISEFLNEHGLDLKECRVYSDEEWIAVVQAFLGIFSQLSSAQRAVLVTLAWPYGKQFAATMMFLQGRCTSRQWAKAIFSRSEEVCRIVGERPIGRIISVSDEAPTDERGRAVEAIINSYERLCAIAQAYLAAVQDENQFAGDG